jgi:hypothetical protein
MVTEIRIAKIGMAIDIRLTELFAWQAHVHKEEWLAWCPWWLAWVVAQKKATKARER